VLIGPGAEIAGFQLEELIGEGGMGVVYRARQLDLGRTVALKLIQPDLRGDQDFRDRFQRESRLAASIDHPNIVPIFQAGEADGVYFIAMRYVDGSDLGAMLRNRATPLSPQTAAALIEQVADGLDAAHAAGLVHRDVKPANVLLDQQQHPYLTDFGLTKHVASESLKTRTGVWLGSINHCAPEQIEGKEVDARTDVYSLGSVLFETLTKHPPYERDSDMALMWAKVHQAPRRIADLNPSVPREFDEVVARALARNPADRYPSAGDLGRAATAAAQGGRNVEPERTVAQGAAAVSPTEPLPTAALPATQRLHPPAEPATRALPRSAKRSSRGRWALIVAAGVAGLAASAAVAVVLLAQGGGKTEVRTVARTVTESEPASPPQQEPEGRSSSAIPPLEAFNGNLYTAQVPVGWIPEAIEKEIAGRFESKWRNPGEASTSLLIDSQLHRSNTTAIEDAESVRAQTSQSSDYREISFEPTTLQGLSAARWVFDVEGVRKVDYFVIDCGIGFGILGASPPTSFGGWAPTFHRIANSVTVYCD
jgi:serine/threonine protein kinase